MTPLDVLVNGAVTTVFEPDADAVKPALELVDANSLSALLIVVNCVRLETLIV